MSGRKTIIGPAFSVADVWPQERPLPSKEQMDEARKRMVEETIKSREEGYDGDWGFTLELTMATYNRCMWWHLFYPDEKIDFRGHPL